MVAAVEVDSTLRGGVFMVARMDILHQLGCPEDLLYSSSTSPSSHLPCRHRLNLTNLQHPLLVMSNHPLDHRSERRSHQLSPSSDSQSYLNSTWPNSNNNRLILKLWRLYNHPRPKPQRLFRSTRHHHIHLTPLHTASIELLQRSRCISHGLRKLSMLPR